MSLKNHREVILLALTKALDECITRESENPNIAQHKPRRFEAAIKVSYEGTKTELLCRPMMDFPV